MRRSPVSSVLSGFLLAALAAGCTTTGYKVTDDAGATDDADVVPEPDLATTGEPRDLAMAAPRDLASTPITGSVSATGGKVSRLYFGFTGDTRPATCDAVSNYPTTIINSIFQKMGALGVSFAVDLGDHVFVCSGTQQNADTQMGYYMSAAQQLAPRPLFMVLGNHECSSAKICGASTGYAPPQFKAYMNALAPISTTPWYSRDIETDAGLARFVFIADNAWSTAEQTWLEQTLSDADAHAKYTFVLRHHPLDNTDQAVYATITSTIRAHKRTLVLTGHSHLFKIDTQNDSTGHTLVMGTGGAPLNDPNDWFGFGTIEQMPTGAFQIRLYDQASGNQVGTFSVSP